MRVEKKGTSEKSSASRRNRSRRKRAYIVTIGAIVFGHVKDAPRPSHYRYYRLLAPVAAIARGLAPARANFTVARWKRTRRLIALLSLQPLTTARCLIAQECFWKFRSTISNFQRNFFRFTKCAWRIIISILNRRSSCFWRMFYMKSTRYCILHCSLYINMSWKHSIFLMKNWKHGATFFSLCEKWLIYSFAAARDHSYFCIYFHPSDYPFTSFYKRSIAVTDRYRDPHLTDTPKPVIKHALEYRVPTDS